MTKFYDAVYSFERVRGYQFVKLYISMFEKWLESPQWLLAVSKPEVRMRVTSAWGQEYSPLIRSFLVGVNLKSKKHLGYPSVKLFWKYCTGDQHTPTA